MESVPGTFSAGPQFVRGTEPVLFRRSFRTASRLPVLMRERRNLFVTEDREAMNTERVPMRLPGLLKRLLGMLQRLPGVFLPGLVVLFLMGFRGAAMSVGGTVVQLGGALMILVVRSVVIASRH